MSTIWVNGVGCAGFAGSLAVSNLSTWHRDEPAARCFVLACVGFAAYSVLEAYMMTSLDVATTATLLRSYGCVR